MLKAIVSVLFALACWNGRIYITYDVLSLLLLFSLFTALLLENRFHFAVHLVKSEVTPRVNTYLKVLSYYNNYHYHF